jgi:NADPH:quinone reductase-like Zn-dependent oxidoreductase
MKAIVYEKYGEPEVLRLENVEQPVPANDELLIKVKASSINSWDWDLITGQPKLYRLLSGLFKPKNKIPGFDIAGIVEAVGKDVTIFKPGDEVAGDLSEALMGAFAEFTCAREKDLVLKPPTVSFEQAASVPQAAILAWQGVNFKRATEPGEKVLINGAGGGVGAFAIQMAKLLGAEVTAVDSGEKLEMMIALGADHVMEYQITDFVKSGKKYDRIIDVVASRSVSDYKRVLNKNGILAVIGGKIPSLLRVAVSGIFNLGNKTMGLVVHKPNKDLALILNLIETGKIKITIDRGYKLEDIRDAFRYYSSGKHKGKIAILV